MLIILGSDEHYRAKDVRGMSCLEGEESDFDSDTGLLSVAADEVTLVGFEPSRLGEEVTFVDLSELRSDLHTSVTDLSSRVCLNELINKKYYETRKCFM